jgi:hypothetical protein
MAPKKNPAPVPKAAPAKSNATLRRKAVSILGRRRRCFPWVRRFGILFEVFVTVGLCMALVLWCSARPHLSVDVPGTTFSFTLFSNTHSDDSAARNKYGTTLAMVDHLDEKSVAFGQYSIGVHGVLVATAWTCGRVASTSLFVHRDAYDRLLTTMKPLQVMSNYMFRGFAVVVALGGLALSALFIDIADGYSTTGIKTSGGKTGYRSAGYRSDGGYLFQFIPLAFGLMLWVAF